MSLMMSLARFHRHIKKFQIGLSTLQKKLLVRHMALQVEDLPPKIEERYSYLAY